MSFFQHTTFSIPRERLFDGLNVMQRQAVETTEGPLLVLAGAGTGKTRVITHRIAYLLTRGVRPEQILAITFTRKAAREMGERAIELIGRHPSGLTVSTFHALGFRILREQAAQLNICGQLAVIDEEDKIRLVAEILKRLDPENSFSPEGTLGMVSRAKNQGVTPKQLAGEAETDHDHQAVAIYKAYCEELRRRNAIDLDDMVCLPVELLERDEQVRNHYRRSWRYLLIDEYQDTNAGQYRLIQCLLGEQQNLCVVGDDDQSIYSFRGAEVERILRFEADFPKAQLIKLELNYRSHTEIISLGNAVIEHARKRYPKRLVSERGAYAPVYWKKTASDAEEAQFIAVQIRGMNEDACLKVQYGDIAVIVRAQATATAIGAELKRSGIPHKRGAGANGEAAVTIMTLHQSKGLEFPVVFLPALEEDSLPHFHAVRDGQDAVEEERRLFYVGVTRAQQRLFITSAHYRNNHRREPSRFLTELDQTNYLQVV